MTTHLFPPQSYTQKGRRPYQEDARYPDTDRPATERPAFFLVCDGVGGQDKGEVASRTVCDTFGQLLEGSAIPLPQDAAQFQALFDKVYTRFSEVARAQCTTMATTLTFLCFHDGGYTAAHCGDSRIYHIRPGKGIVYQTEDHSLVQELVRNGVITPEEAVNHPQGNIITRCIMLPQDGTNDQPRVTVHQSSDLQAGDYFLLCTDGVVHEANDTYLVSFLSDTGLSDEQKIAQLAQQTANSSDNNTAYLLHVERVEGTAPARTTTADTAATSGKAPTPVPGKAPAADASTTQDIKPRTPSAADSPSLLTRIKNFFQ